MDIAPYLEHEALLKKRLPQLTPRQRMFFTAWCCDRLWADFGETYLSLIGAERATLLRDTYDHLWSDLLKNRPIRETEIHSLLPVLDKLGDEHADYIIELDNQETATNLCYHYAMAFAVTESDDEAFYAGMELLNLADHFSNGGMTDPIFIGEVQRQREMLKYLSGRSLFDRGDRFLFREESPFWLVE
ncbi:MAG: hypothetical protein H7145_22985 [Akkermansiaceae bacterium]|nr:hypothetical protein [Armatimonadota bacterium]